MKISDMHEKDDVIRKERKLTNWKGCLRQTRKFIAGGKVYCRKDVVLQEGMCSAGRKVSPWKEGVPMEGSCPAGRKVSDRKVIVPLEGRCPAGRKVSC